MEETASKKTLIEQNYKVIKYVIIIFCFAFVCILIAAVKPILGIIIIIFASALAVYIYYQFNKYLLNFTLYSNIRNYIKGAIIGIASIGIGHICLILSLYTSHTVALIGMPFLLLGPILWLFCQLVIAIRLPQNIDDFVGGISEAGLGVGRFLPQWLVIMIFPLFFYQVFSHAEDYTNGYER